MTTHRADRITGLLAFSALLLLHGAGCGEGEPEGTLASQESAEHVCLSSDTVPGVDVSEWQGRVDWKHVRHSGRRFAIARVSDGTYRDPEFDRNWHQMRRAGLIRGVYQYFRASQDPVHQADLLLAAVGTLRDGDLPPVLDVETTDGVSHDRLRNGIRRWVERVQHRTGRRPIIYTGSYFWDDAVGDHSFGARLWLAQWGVHCPLLPRAWRRWTLLQTTDGARVPGIAGSVDGDRFNGSLEQLRQLARWSR